MYVYTHDVRSTEYIDVYIGVLLSGESQYGRGNVYRAPKASYVSIPEYGK